MCLPVYLRELGCPDGCAELLQLMLPVSHTIEAEEARVQLNPVRRWDPRQHHLHLRLIQQDVDGRRLSGPLDADRYLPERATPIVFPAGGELWLGEEENSVRAPLPGLDPDEGEAHLLGPGLHDGGDGVAAGLLQLSPQLRGLRILKQVESLYPDSFSSPLTTIYGWQKDKYCTLYAYLVRYWLMPLLKFSFPIQLWSILMMEAPCVKNAIWLLSGRSYVWDSCSYLCDINQYLYILQVGTYPSDPFVLKYTGIFLGSLIFRVMLDIYRFWVDICVEYVTLHGHSCSVHW